MIRQQDVDDMWAARAEAQERLNSLHKRIKALEAQCADTLQASQIYARAAYVMEKELKSNATQSS